MSLEKRGLGGIGKGIIRNTCQKRENII